jgi:ABC-type multidrug transport system permease subunit
MSSQSYFEQQKHTSGVLDQQKHRKHIIYSMLSQLLRLLTTLASGALALFSFFFTGVFFFFGSYLFALVLCFFFFGVLLGPSSSSLTL